MSRSNKDIKKAEDYIDLVKIMFTSTTAVSSETSPTIGQIVPTLQRIKKHFAVDDTDCGFRRDIKKTVWENLSTHYQVLLF